MCGQDELVKDAQEISEQLLGPVHMERPCGEDGRASVHFSLMWMHVFLWLLQSNKYIVPE